MDCAHTMLTRRPWMLRMLPMLRWWPMVDRRSLRADLLAGLTGAVILVPQAVAYASIAGLPPEYGLYTAIVPVVIAALFGSSWHLVSGPTAAISIVVFATLSPLAEPGSAAYVGLVLTLTFMVGVLTLLMGLARLGSLVNFVSQSVVVGFTAGAAMLIATSQLKNFFGLTLAAGGRFLDTLGNFVRQVGDLDPYVTSVGMATLAASVLARHYLPRAPYMNIAMLVGSLCGLLANALADGANRVPTVSAVPRGLPPLSAPVWSLETLRQLASIALALTLLSLTEALAIARAVALKSGQRIDGNQEFFGQGLANLLGSFFSAYVSSGSFTRSGINYSAGARTPLAAVFSSLCLVATLLALAPALRFLPIASMAAILFLVAYSLIDWHHIGTILKTSRSESAVLLATLLATLFLQLEFAIYVGVALSLLLFLERSARPSVRDAVPAPGAASYHYVEQGNDGVHRRAAVFRRRRSRAAPAAPDRRHEPGPQASAAARARPAFRRPVGRRAAGPGGAPPQAARRRPVLPPPAAAGARDARQGRLPARDRTGEPVRDRAGRDGLALPAARSRDLPPLHPARLQAVRGQPAQWRAALKPPPARTHRTPALRMTP